MRNLPRLKGPMTHTYHAAIIFYSHMSFYYQYHWERFKGVDTFHPEAGWGAQHPNPTDFIILVRLGCCNFYTFLTLNIFPKKKTLVTGAKKNPRTIPTRPCCRKYNIHTRLPPFTNQTIKWLIDFLYRSQISLVCMRERPVFHNPVNATQQPNRTTK